jgi:hypothetical protein
MTGPWALLAPDCPRNPPKTPPETAGTLVVCAGQIVLRRTPETARIRGRADVAQLVEHLHGKEGVRGDLFPCKWWVRGVKCYDHYRSYAAVSPRRGRRFAVQLISLAADALPMCAVGPAHTKGSPRGAAYG